MSQIVCMRTPAQCTFPTVHPVTQWNVVTWWAVGSAMNSSHVKVVGFSTWPPTLKR